MDVNGIGGSDGSAAARLRQSIQERLAKGQQAQAGRFVNADLTVMDGAGTAGASSAAPSGGADLAGVAKVEGPGEAGEVEGPGEGAEDEASERQLGHLEVTVTQPDAMADPAGIAKATAVRGAAAYRRTAEATGLRAASPGISVAA